MQNTTDLCIMIEIIQQWINILEKERKGNPKVITLQELSQQTKRYVIQKISKLKIPDPKPFAGKYMEYEF